MINSIPGEARGFFCCAVRDFRKIDFDMIRK